MSQVMASTPAQSATTDPFALYLRESGEGQVHFVAGFPSYPANFSRDVFIAGMLASRADMIASQLAVSAQHQGTKHDPLTGEKPGSIHHEFPGAQLAGRGQGYTTYNACDTTALFLIAHEGLMHLDASKATKFQTDYLQNVRQAARYILDHVEHDLYWERPPKGGAKFTLRVTYWKDSILPHADGKTEPHYPVTFALAHFMAARSLLSASLLLADPKLAARADAMYRAGISEFMRPSEFVVYRDQGEIFAQSSSDELHALAYIPKKYATLLPLQAIRARAKSLETDHGYTCTPYQVAKNLADKYHGDAVWVMDQALSHYGATKFGLLHEAQVAARVAPHIKNGQELLAVIRDENGSAVAVEPAGNDQQLWSVAAAEYLAGRSTLASQTWL